MITKASFGRAEIYTIANSRGIEARVMTYGATIVSLKTPDRRGKVEEILLGFDSLAPYLSSPFYFGATVGRYANRIAGARFAVDGVPCRLAANDGRNALHGGIEGFDKRMWDADTEGENAVRMRYLSPDGEEGYPGDLAAQVTYRLDEDDTLSVIYEATTTAPTPVNLVNHAYFNLTGGKQDILGHELTIAASSFLPVDAGLIPTGEAWPVAGTPFDFRTPESIGARIAAPDEQIRRGSGYDHSWVLDKSAPAAILTDPKSGRRLEVRTTQPGLHVYSGNFLDARHGGVCLETQHFPDSPNRADFPDTILRPGETYRQTTQFTFRTAQ